MRRGQSGATAGPGPGPCRYRSRSACAGPEKRRQQVGQGSVQPRGWEGAVRASGTFVLRAGAGSALPCSAPGDRSGPGPSAAPGPPAIFGVGPVFGRREQGRPIPSRFGPRRSRGSCGAGRVSAAVSLGFHLEEFWGAVERGLPWRS